MNPAEPGSAEPAGLREQLGQVLRGGVVLSAALLLIGLALVAREGGVGRAGSIGSLPLGSLLSNLASGQAWAFLWLGIVVLAVTPVARVLLALEQFARARDRAYVAITGFVLGVLLASLILGVASG